MRIHQQSSLKQFFYNAAKSEEKNTFVPFFHTYTIQGYFSKKKARLISPNALKVSNKNRI